MPDRLDCPAHGNALTGAEAHGGLFEGAPPLYDVVLMNPPLLLADDHTLFWKGLASLLEKEKHFEIVGEAAVPTMRSHTLQKMAALGL